MTKVTFLSPGTFVSETSTLETDLTDPREIQHLAKGITERHGAKPYAFQIEGDPKTYWFGKNRVLSFNDIPDTRENRILRSNMVNNGYEFVIENTNSWKFTAPFDPQKNEVLS